jgi:hypothetical protein
MPNVYIENAEKWKALTDIDYFTQFVKAWITFNAWYKNVFDYERDRDAIDHIKTNSNSFRDRIEALLNSNTTEGRLFQSRVADLHQQLENWYIYVDQERTQRITFDQIIIERNPERRRSFVRNTLVYTVERGPGGSAETNIAITVEKEGGGPTRYSYAQGNGYNLNDLLDHPDFNQLTQAQRNNLRACYEYINPWKPACLLVHDMDTPDYLEISGIRFVDDVDLLCKGLIEILYKLRNALFHGTLVPDSQTRQVYGPAYHILHTLIQAL